MDLALLKAAGVILELLKFIFLYILYYKFLDSVPIQYVLNRFGLDFLESFFSP